jgi:hypothetical protein
MDFIQLTLTYANGTVFNVTSAYGFDTGDCDFTEEQATYVVA